MASCQTGKSIQVKDLKGLSRFTQALLLLLLLFIYINIKKNTEDI
jgi:hypothetical protein